MSRAYIYEFGRFGALQRSVGIPIQDATGAYICGEPSFVWWWPINWFVIAIGLPIVIWQHHKGQRK